MAFLDDLFTWGVIAALGYAAWKFKVEPALKAKKEQEKKPPKAYNAHFKEIE